MHATGIVAEYNPLHNGHLLHINKTKKITGSPVIAVMSGSIMQRGEPAFIDKWNRARLAVQNGVDLVLELPASFSLRSAEFFARGAVEILQATGCVKNLSCGAENPQQNFAELAKIVKSENFQEKLRNLLAQGNPYAAAYEQALLEKTCDAKLKTPNDILALEYSKALLATNIKPIFIQRQEADYNAKEICGKIASATAIRTAYNEGNLQNISPAVPFNVWQAIQNGAGYDEKLLWQLVSYRLRMLTPFQIAEQCQCSEGLENLLKQAANCHSLLEAVQKCSNKRYPATRIRRLFLQLVLHKPKYYFEQEHPAYLRVLAFNDTGRQILKIMKDTATLPIITKLGKNPAANQSATFTQQLELELAASDLLSMLQGKNLTGSDYLTSPYYNK